MSEKTKAEASQEDGVLVCSKWRKCCCQRADDGHCWGCGQSETVHVNPRDEEKEVVLDGSH